MWNAVSIGLCVAALAGSARHDGLHEQIAALTREIVASPADPELHLRRADLYRLHGQRDAALADIGHAEELAPGLDGLLLCRARIFVDAGELSSARRILEHQLELHPGDADALLLHSELERARGAFAEAVRDLDRAIAALDSPEPDPYLARADLLAAMGPAGVDLALDGLDAGLARMGPVTALELRAIELEKSRGRFDHALARLAAIAARSPRQERWLAERGEILLDAGRPGEALEAFGDARVALACLPLRHRSSAAMHELEAAIDCRLAELGARLAREEERSGDRGGSEHEE